MSERGFVVHDWVFGSGGFRYAARPACGAAPGPRIQSYALASDIKTSS